MLLFFFFFPEEDNGWRKSDAPGSILVDSPASVNPRVVSKNCVYLKKKKGQTDTRTGAKAGGRRAERWILQPRLFLESQRRNRPCGLLSAEEERPWKRRGEMGGAAGAGKGKVFPELGK